MLVKKSSLIWLLNNEKGHLSSDRQLRVRGVLSSEFNTIKKNIRRKKQTAKTEELLLSEESSELSSESYMEEQLVLDDTEEVSSEYEDSDIGDSAENDLKPQEILLERYYVVYYDDDWYLGRSISLKQNNTQFKFLKRNLEQFIWPKKDDIDEVLNEFVLYGPIALIGNGPFEIKRYQLFTN